MAAEEYDDGQSFSDLLCAARSAWLEYQASPEGTWVRFQGEDESAYVIAEPLADGYSVLLFDGTSSTRVGYFRDARGAVKAALHLLRYERKGVKPGRVWA